MQFLRLNLIAPIKKNRLRKLIQFLFTKELLEIVILTSAIVAVTNLVGWLMLAHTASDLAQTSLLVNREPPPFVQDIRRVNKLIKDLFSASQDFYPLTPRLFELMQKVPPDIKISAIILDRDAQTAELDGVAATRDAFLRFQEVLSHVDWISTVTTPASQLFQKENIGFQFNMTLKNVPRLKPLPRANPTPRPINND